MGGVHKIDGATRGYGFRADNAICEDTKVLVCFTDTDDYSRRRREIGRCENGDMGLQSWGGEGKANQCHRGGQQSLHDVLTNAGLRTVLAD